MKLVFVIVNYNCEHDIEQLSTQISTYGDIVVVDNSGTWNNSNKKIKVVNPGENLGFGRAIDYAIINLMLIDKYEFLTICNPDITIRNFDEWDSVLENFSQSTYSYFQPLVLSQGYQNSIQGLPIARNHVWPMSYISFNPWRRRVKANDTNKEIGVFSGAFCIFKSTALKAIGGFSTLNFLYFEELDMALKIRERGLELGYFDSRISVDHYVGATTGQRKGSFNYRMHIIKLKSFLRTCRVHRMQYLSLFIFLDFVVRLCLGYSIYAVGLVTKPSK